MVSPARSWRMLALISAGSLVLAGCGGGDDDKTTGAEPSSSSSAGGSAPKGDGTLTLGSLLPQTGNLAFLGPPEFAGLELAVKEINEAGGVLGKDVVYIEGDSGDAQQDVANPTVDRLRVVSDDGTNLRVNPITGALAATDGRLAYRAGDPAFGVQPGIGDVAYTNNDADCTTAPTCPATATPCNW